MSLNILATSEEEAELAKFTPSEWIGVGKLIADLPDYVNLAKDQALAIPKEHIHLLPHNDLPINTLSEKNLPNQSLELVQLKPDFLFSMAKPNVTVKTILNRPVPSPELLRVLKREVDQAWLDGKQSIKDWRYNEGVDLFPLWVLSFWGQMALVIRKHTEWERGKGFLESLETGTKGEDLKTIAKTIQLSFNTLGWNSTLPFL